MTQIGGLKYQVDQSHLQSLKKAQEGFGPANARAKFFGTARGWIK